MDFFQYAINAVVIAAIVTFVVAAVLYKRGLFDINPTDVKDDILDSIKESADTANKIVDAVEEAADEAAEVADRVRETTERTRAKVRRATNRKK